MFGEKSCLSRGLQKLALGWQEKELATLLSRHFGVVSEQDFVLSQEEKNPDVSEYVNLTASGIFLCLDHDC